MVACAACRRRQRKGILHLFHFPREPIVLGKWTKYVQKALNRPTWAPTAGSRLCQEHFETSDVRTVVSKTGKERTFLRFGRSPTIIVHYDVRNDWKRPDGKRSSTKFAPCLDPKKQNASRLRQHKRQTEPSPSPDMEEPSPLGVFDDVSSDISDQFQNMNVSDEENLCPNSPILKGKQKSNPLVAQSQDEESKTKERQLKHVYEIEFNDVDELKDAPCDVIMSEEDSLMAVKIIWPECVPERSSEKIQLNLPVGTMSRADKRDAPFQAVVAVEGQSFNNLPDVGLAEEQTTVTLHVQLSSSEEHIWNELNLDGKSGFDRELILLRTLSQKIEQLRIIQDAVSKILQDDQINLLKENAEFRNNVKWSVKSIEKAILLRAAVGKKGYDYLRSLKWPIPCERTIQYRTRHLIFAPGMQDVIIKALGSKMGSDPLANLAAISTDEMSMNNCIELDPSLKKNIGYESPDLSKKAEAECFETAATHLMIVVARGLAVHWRQPIAYDFTGASTDPRKLWQFLADIIKFCFICSIWIAVLITDSGSNNTAVWRLKGVYANKHGINNLVPHPGDPSRYLVIMPDPPHVLKGVKQTSVTYVTYLPKWYTDMFHLCTNEVRVKDHVTLLIELQESEGGVVLVKGLNSDYLEPLNWEKMRVSFSLMIINRRLVAALRWCVIADYMPQEVLATAQYLESCCNWYDIMRSRDMATGIAKTSHEAVETLEFTINLFRDVRFGLARSWFPCQTGVLLASKGILQLHRLYVMGDEPPLKYILPCRATSEPSENIFSLVRQISFDSNPGPISCRQSIKNISIVSGLKLPKGSSYEDGGDSGALSLIDLVPEEEESRPQLEMTSLKLKDAIPLQSNMKKAVLYHMASWVAHSLIKNLKTFKSCGECLDFLITKERPNELWSQYTENLNQGHLTFGTKKLFNLVLALDSFFCRIEQELSSSPNIIKNLVSTFLSLQPLGVFKAPPCHELFLLQKVSSKFLESSLKKKNKDFKDGQESFLDSAGKTALMISSVRLRKRKRGGCSSDIHDNSDDEEYEPPAKRVCTWDEFLLSLDNPEALSAEQPDSPFDYSGFGTASELLKTPPMARGLSTPPNSSCTTLSVESEERAYILSSPEQVTESKRRMFGTKTPRLLGMGYPILADGPLKNLPVSLTEICELSENVEIERAKRDLVVQNTLFLEEHEVILPNEKDTLYVDNREYEEMSEAISLIQKGAKFAIKRRDFKHVQYILSSNTAVIRAIDDRDKSKFSYAEATEALLYFAQVYVVFSKSQCNPLIYGDPIPESDHRIKLVQCYSARQVASVLVRLKSIAIGISIPDLPKAALKCDKNIYAVPSPYNKRRAMKMIKVPGIVGLTNVGNSCCLNTVLQNLFASQQLHKLIAHKGEDIICRKNDQGLSPIAKLIVSELADLVSLAYTQETTKLVPHALADLLYSAHPDIDVVNQQHDPFEVLMHLLQLTLDVVLKRRVNNRIDSIGGVFLVQMTSRSECASSLCNYVNEDYCPKFSIPLYMEDSWQQMDVKVAVKKFFTPEFITDWSCTKCNCSTKLIKTYELVSEPLVLICQIIRFSEDAELKWNFPVKMDAVLPPLQIGNFLLRLELSGMMIHIGKSRNRGHYISAIRKRNRWFLINDDLVRLTTFTELQDLFACDVYGLFYDCSLIL